MKDVDIRILNIIENTFFSFNFGFFKSVILPFFRNNPKFVSSHINSIIKFTKYDHSCIFASELLKHPDLDLNYIKDSNDSTFLESAIYFNNTNVVELILSQPTIDINQNSTSNPLFCACAMLADMKIIKMICSNPDIDANFVEPDSYYSIVEVALFVGNAFALKYLIENFSYLKKSPFRDAINCLQEKHFLTLKIFLRWFMDDLDQEDFDELIKILIEDDYFDENTSDILENLINEIKASE